MPGSKCSVKYCENKSTSLQIDNVLSFHRFPKNPAIRKAWIEFCNRNEDWKPTDTSRVCSDHFESCSFEKNDHDQFSHSISRRKLVTNAIPTKSINNWNQWNPSNVMNIPKVEVSFPPPVDPLMSTSNRKLVTNAIPTESINSWNPSNVVNIPKVEVSFPSPVDPFMSECTSDNKYFQTNEVEITQLCQKSSREIELEEQLRSMGKRIEDLEKLNQQLKDCNNSLAKQLSVERKRTGRLQAVIDGTKKKHSDCIKRGYWNQQ